MRTWMKHEDPHNKYGATFTLGDRNVILPPGAVISVTRGEMFNIPRLIIKESLFSFEELLKMPSKERLPIFFSSRDLRPYAKELRSRSPRGADGHCRQGILRALLAAPLEGIATLTALHHRLSTDLRFRYQGCVPSSGGNSTIETEIDITSAMPPPQSADETFVRSTEPWILN